MNPESPRDNKLERDQLRKPKSVELKMVAGIAKTEQARCGSGVCQVEWKPPVSSDRDSKKAASN
jgi:hypothetical protein